MECLLITASFSKSDMKNIKQTSSISNSLHYDQASIHKSSFKNFVPENRQSKLRFT